MFLHCKKYKLKIQNIFKYLSGYNNKEHKNTMTTTVYTRITSSRQANEHIGEVCSFISKGVREYGRIVYVTPTSIRIERMQQTADGDFILHPKQKNSVTNNVITFTRKITIASESIASESIASESIAAAAAAVPVFPSPLILLGGIKRRYQNAQSTEQSGWW
jgi:hypothetical protein